MSKTRLGLMGFGRTGRHVFRQLEDHAAIEVAAIADIVDPAALVYLLKFDTVFGRFPKPVNLEDSTLRIDGRSIPMLTARDPGDVDWADLGVEIVVNATRKHRSAAELQGHLDKGAQRVILACAPENPDDMDTLIMGANDRVLDRDDLIISLGSNISNALAPVLRIFEESFGVDHAMFTAVHAFTKEQRLADVPGTDLRLSRAAAENIIPATTEAPAVVGHVIPSLAGKVSGIALNVPVPDGSNIDLVAFLSREVSAGEVNDAVKAASEGSTVLEYTDEPIVSSDVIGNPHSAVYDGLATLVTDGDMVKSIIWFDNSWGYAARVVELVGKLAAFEQGGKSE